MNNTTICVIVPVYNAGSTLDRCVESIVNQTYKDLQIILVENGSTDNSYFMCQEWAKKDNRIMVLQSEKGESKARNAGVFEALNAGYAYIAFVDSDDYVELNLYEELYKKAESTGADITFCDYYAEYGNNNSSIVSITDKNKKYLQRHDYKYFFYHGKNAMMGVVWRSLFSAKRICSKISFCEDTIFAQDLIYTINALNHASNLAFVSNPLYHYVVPQSFINKYYSPKLTYERQIYYRELENKLVGKNKKYHSYIKAYILVDMLSAIIKLNKDYKEQIAELYKIEFYRDARRQFCGMLRLVLFGRKGIRSRAAALVLYLGMYDFYAKHMTKKHG